MSLKARNITLYVHYTQLFVKYQFDSLCTCIVHSSLIIRILVVSTYPELVFTVMENDPASAAKYSMCSICTIHIVPNKGCNINSPIVSLVLLISEVQSVVKL